MKLKSLCVCLDANAEYDGVLGGIYWDTDTLSDNYERLEVDCMGYPYDPSDGRRRAWKTCDDWRPLSK